MRKCTFTCDRCGKKIKKHIYNYSLASTNVFGSFMGLHELSIDVCKDCLTDFQFDAVKLFYGIEKALYWKKKLVDKEEKK